MRVNVTLMHAIAFVLVTNVAGKWVDNSRVLERVKRVVGGRRSRANSHPWQVYLDIDPEENVFCGASIIGKRHIVTAAHCVTDTCGYPVRKLWARLGAHDVCSQDWIGSHLVRHQRIHLHPGYNPSTFDNDIAVLELKRDIKFGPKVRKVRLPDDESIADCINMEYDEETLVKQREDCERATGNLDYEYGITDYESSSEYDLEEDYESSGGESDYEDNAEYGDYSDYYDEEEYTEGEEENFYEDEPNDYVVNFKYEDNCTTYFDGKWATVVGWGSTSRTSGTCLLREAKIKIYPNHDELCQDEENFVLDEDKICAYNPHNSSDSCQGDSGSGLLVFPPGEPPVLVGVVSHGAGCGEVDSPGVYARVQHFVEWIRSVMEVEYNVD